jgi:hypothetical protein
VAAIFEEEVDPGLITLQTARRPLHPWAVALPDVAALGVGLPCSSNRSCLEVGAQWRIPLDAVRVEPLTVPTWTPQEARRALGRTSKLQDVLDKTPPPSDKILIGAEPMPSALSRLRAVLDQTIGRGSGSTPSGDDYAVGQLAVLWALTGTSPQAVHQIKGLQSLLRWDKLKERTPLGSAQMILSATNGHFCRAIGTFVRSLGQAETPSLKTSCRPLLSLGASSGRAMLAGIVDGLRRAGLWYETDV